MASNPPERPPVPASVGEAERTIRNQKFETVHVWGADGVYRFGKNGDENSADPSDEEKAFVKDGLFLHNHPSDYSFGRRDIMFVLSANPAEFRAIGPKTRYVIIRPASGWPNNFMAEWLKWLKTFSDRHDKSFISRKINEKEYNRRVYADTMKRVTSTLNIEYREEGF